MKRVARTLEYQDIERHRHEDCAGYRRCLDMAAQSQWRSFSCEGCDHYVALPREEPEEPPCSCVDWLDRAWLLL